MKRGYCAVTGDILHIGHLHYLMKCKQQCDFLIVGVMTDKCVEEYKNKKPIFSLEDRMLIVGSLVWVNQIVEQGSFEFSFIKEWLRPDIIFDSEEHKRKGADIIIPSMPRISSTIIKERIIEEYLNNSKRKKKRRAFGW